VDAHALYRAVFWAAADAILVADEDGRYLDANPAAVTLLGYSRENLLRLQVADVVALDAAWTAAEYDGFLHAGTWSGELELRRRDGTLVPVEAHATAVPWHKGQPVYISVIRDISSRRATERMQREFLAMVTHELKTPLTGILGHAQLMQHRAAYSAPSIDSIIAQARRLQRLIDDLLDVAHFDSGQPDLRRSLVNLAALAQDAADQAMIIRPTHPVQVEAPEQPLVGWWDADRVTQVLQNLLANAGKYSPEGSALRVRVKASRGEALVAVIDRGTGVAPEELPRLFDRFYRTESASRSGAQGLGLGLHICSLLVQAHGGRIWAQSILGQGTTVSFTLPYAQVCTV
jgi:PAS domain S-box-containing protein